MIYVFSSTYDRACDLADKHLVSKKTKVVSLPYTAPHRLRGLTITDGDVIIANDVDMSAKADERFWDELSYTIRGNPIFIDVSP